jgi:hypothetical protein
MTWSALPDRVPSTQYSHAYVVVLVYDETIGTKNLM